MRISRRSQPRSTAALARASAGRHPPKPSTTIYYRSNKAVLHPLVEPGQYTSNSWTHSLGYRGHILTKSRRYSTTYGALCEERAEYQRGDTQPTDNQAVITESNWRYFGSGYTAGAARLAAGIAEDIAASRELAREEKADRGFEA
ncbi:replication initiator [Streptomyces sp. YIM S03343]